MGEEVGAQGVAGVQALHGTQVPGHLCHTLPEAQTQEVQRQGVGVKEACGWRQNTQAPPTSTLKLFEN